MIYKDERGEITDVAEGDFKAIQIITSKKGSVRSNHYHKRGGHLLYVLEGKMRYLEHDAQGDMLTIRERVVGKGEDPQWLYTVRFDAQELWGVDADPKLKVSIEAFEPYLEHA